ncbi:heavy metal-responsive transcriptional regulator [Pseudothauera rhizosphaerae]|uniref:Heavy metal-responsive transcriptional regulator n=1 Tax=Pseudothauera rhizosphaerae TaxID=2565932 RepID=A0A4S4AYR3_9RHOO|nr:heavy metal-responsive transcriptional regulator [Pseudothauera rhizosphaerae]THF65297.1 heavy metal-responsive transcriptional regulator [Pseudothauera rhizosphaerae]
MNIRHATSHFTIGTLSRETGVPVDTLRFYEREGLLPAARRRSSGYREYDDEAVKRVRFILRAKELGFSLDEIADLLNFSADPEHGVQGVKARASARLAEIERQIAHLDTIRQRLTRLVAACPGSGSPECCPILADIRAEEQGSGTAAAGSSCCGNGAAGRSDADKG